MIKLKILTPYVALILTSIFIPVFMYTNNAEHISFVEVLPSLLVFLGVGIFIFSIFLLVTRNISKSCLSAILIFLVLSNYIFLEKLLKIFFPLLKYWHGMPLALVITLHIIYFIYKKIGNEVSLVFTSILCITFTVLILFNFIMAMPAFMQKITLKDDNINIANQITENDMNEDLPNVYYLLFDEYSSFDVIKKYYDYDNENFANWLIDSGFFVSNSSLNNSHETVTVLTNYMNLDYVVDDNTPPAESKRLRENGKLIKLFLQYEYKIIGLGNSESVGIESKVGRGVGKANTIEGESFQQMILNNTIIYPFFTNSVVIGENSKIIIESFSYFSEYINYYDIPTFTIAYLVTPHQPFLFDKDGKAVRPHNYHNWNDKEYYLNQYVYITKLIKSAVTNIIANDPDSIIILQSDHSARSVSGIVDTDRRKILNAIYYPNNDLSEIEGCSGVNTLRIVLSELFDINLPVLVETLPTS